MVVQVGRASEPSMPPPSVTRCWHGLHLASLDRQVAMCSTSSTRKAQRDNTNEEAAPRPTDFETLSFNKLQHYENGKARQKPQRNPVSQVVKTNVHKKSAPRNTTPPPGSLPPPHSDMIARSKSFFVCHQPQRVPLVLVAALGGREGWFPLTDQDARDIHYI